VNVILSNMARWKLLWLADNRGAQLWRLLVAVFVTVS